MIVGRHKGPTQERSDKNNMLVHREQQVRALVERHAPPEFIENNQEGCSYLCSLIMSEDRTDTENLAQVIDQFFGHDDSNEDVSKDTRRLAKELTHVLSHDGQSDDSSADFCLSPSQETKNLDHAKSLAGSQVPDTIPEDGILTTESDDSSQDDKKGRSAKKEAREKKRQERAAKKAARLEKKKNAQHHEASSLNEFDDSASAWEERKKEGKAWGGRGHGGRGVRGDVNTASNIHLQSVTLQFAGNELLENSTIQINGGHRYGLVGRNGCGKSTLLRRLAQKDIPGFPQNVKVLLVEQHLTGGKESALEALLNADEDRVSLLLEQEQLEQEIENAVQGGDNTDLEQAVQRLGDVAGELDAIDADGAEERAREILRGLQFSKDMTNGPTENLSGGWRMRLALAQALFVPSDVLLLDEPTNHLDLHALLWLTNYLQNSNHTLIVVSHDQAFLDICTDIISFEHKKLKYHVGNYSAFEQQQEEHAARQAQILDASERQRTKAEAFVQKQQASANKKRQDPKKQRQAKMIKEKKLERIGMYREDGKRYKNMSLKKLSEDHLRVAQKVVIEADEPVLRFRFPKPRWAPGMLTGSALVKMDDLSFGYAPDKPPLLEGLTLDLNRGSKIAVVGRNGAGKSTLMKLITEELPPTDGSSYTLKGKLWRHPTLRIGHVTQHSVEDLESFSNMTVVEYAENHLRSGSACADILESASGNIRQYLGAFGLGGKHAKRRIGSLSGGERMRLCFATIFAESPHMLVLDEATNHLDMETLDTLSAALDAFEGAVVMVSHNQGFLCGFCKELWVVDEGHVDVRHNDTQSFEEMFTEYRADAMIGAKIRGDARAARAKMAKRAQQQRVGTAQKGGFIG